MNTFETEAARGTDRQAFPDGPPAAEPLADEAASARAAGEDGAPGRRTRTPKGEQTRALILETALDLFRERGDEETTMRAIAERAGVALGSAYYYSRWKDHLSKSFCVRSLQRRLAAGLP